jgi:serine/threonine protein kinase/LysM repeat protein
MPNNSFVDYSGQSIDDYQVNKLLVRHELSATYLARVAKSRPVNVEILNSTSEQDPELDGRFYQQMRTLMQHPHPGIAAILHVGHTENNHAYAVSQYTAGVTLASKLKDWHDAGTTLSVLGALQLIKYLAQTLTVVHTLGIFHHDLRPDNIILDKNNSLVFTGLGVPYQTEPPPAQQAGMLDYLAPEQQQGKPINGRSNIYSLGILLYELLVGHRPEIAISDAPASEITTLPEEVPLEKVYPGLRAATYNLVNTCLARQEADRYETIAQFVTAIDDAIDAEIAHARLAKLSKRLYVAVPLALLLIVIAGFLLTRGRSDDVTSLPVTAVATLGTPLPQPTQTARTTEPVETSTAAASPTSATPIRLLFPESGVQFAGNAAIHFDWSYPIALAPGQIFSVQIVTETGTQTLGAVSRPISDYEYRLFVNLADWEFNTGYHQWFIALETIDEGEELLRSEQQPFLIVAVTPTITPIVTLTTQTPSANCTSTPPSGWVVYTVQTGDYLFNLALATGATVEQLQAVNCLATPALGIGQRLWLPALPPTPTQTPTPVPTAIPTEESSGGGSKPSDPGVTKTPPPPPPGF